MPGLLDTGLRYKGKAMQGFLKESEQTAELEKEKKTIEAGERSTKKQMAGSMAGVGAIGGYAAATTVAAPAIGAITGAAAGSAVVPIVGTIIGAGVGYLMSRLF